MEASVREYTVGQLANVAGVSVRTLHYYDEIGLLHPSSRSDVGYRLYVFEDLLRLQQILIYRELELPLEDIGAILDDPGFDPVCALASHRSDIERRIKRLHCLLETIDKTVKNLEEKTMPLTDEELYEGLSKETADRYQKEARQRYDPALVAESERRVRKMSKAQWQALKAEGETVTRALADVMDDDPTGDVVQALIARHFKMIEQFYPVSPDVYRGLGQLYVENDEFRTYYERHRLGLAGFMRAAMTHYADQMENI
jgi:DNA-binding transcriptional MerR regulator